MFHNELTCTTTLPSRIYTSYMRGNNCWGWGVVLVSVVLLKTQFEVRVSIVEGYLTLSLISWIFTRNTDHRAINMTSISVYFMSQRKEKYYSDFRLKTQYMIMPMFGLTCHATSSKGYLYNQYFVFVTYVCQILPPKYYIQRQLPLCHWYQL